ncbi:MAG: hypothetical protein M3Y23_04525 [Actinomycetota bacterium]|nr:hypothetical protein [Actinomycetota bacterium]
MIRTLLVMLLATFGAATFAPAAHGSWQPPVAVGSSADPASVVSSAGADGTAVVAWTSGGGVYASAKPSGSGFETPIHLGEGSQVQVAVDDQGEILVAWIGGSGVLFSTRPASGGFSAAVSALQVPGLTQLSVAANSSGRMLVAYASPTARGLVTRPRGSSAFTSAWSTAEPVIHTSLSVTGGPGNDDAWVAWSDRDG